MSALAKVFYTPEQYLEMERVSEIRHEYHNGEIFAMAGGTEQHSLITTNTIFAMKLQLKGRPCRTYESNMRIWIDAAGLYTYPDVAVVCGERQFLGGRTDILLNPALIVEVLSKSTESYDRNEKFGFYRQIPSLTDYLLIAQDRYSITHFARHADGAWPDTGVETIDPDGAITIRSINCSVALIDIYDQVDFESK